MPGNQDLIGIYEQVHVAHNWGNTSAKYLRYLRPEIRLRGPSSIIDYGCGKSSFIDRLELGAGVELFRYDPAIPGISTPPASPADMLVNFDVLEHIPETDLDEVLSHMRSLCSDAIIVVDTKEAALLGAVGHVYPLG